VGSLEPFHNIRKELPWHKAAAAMFAAGEKSRKIAQVFGKSETWISNLIRQPFFQARISAFLSESTRNVMAELKTQELASLATLVEIRDDPKAPAAARVQAARDILDRAMGRPVARVEAVNEVTSSDPVGEVRMLEAEGRHGRGA
jgi:hypothetical protein